MAGHAVCLRIITEQFEPDTNQILVQFQCLFHDAGLGVNEGQGVYVRFAPDATPGQIEILETKGTYYPTMDLSKTDMIYLDVKRGI